MNLAHGLGFEAMRSERPDLSIGNIYNFHPREPASEREEDEAAALMLDALWNRSFPDPQIHGRYPEPFAAEMEQFVEPGDLDVIRQKPDYFAINHYTRTRVRHDPDHPFQEAGDDQAGNHGSNDTCLLGIKGADQHERILAARFAIVSREQFGTCRTVFD